MTRTDTSRARRATAITMPILETGIRSDAGAGPIVSLTSPGMEMSSTAGSLDSVLVAVVVGVAVGVAVGVSGAVSIAVRIVLVGGGVVDVVVGCAVGVVEAAVDTRAVGSSA